MFSLSPSMNTEERSKYVLPVILQILNTLAIPYEVLPGNTVILARRVAVMMCGAPQRIHAHVLLHTSHAICIKTDGLLSSDIEKCPLLAQKLAVVEASQSVLRMLSVCLDPKPQSGQANGCDIPCVFSKQMADASRLLDHDFGKFVMYGSGKRMYRGNPGWDDVERTQQYMKQAVTQLLSSSVDCPFLIERNHLFTRLLSLASRLGTQNWNADISFYQTCFNELRKELEGVNYEHS